MSKAKIAVVGLGAYGRVLLKTIAKVDNLKLVACYDLNESHTKTVADEYGCRASGSLEELYNDDQIQGIVFVTPNYMHCDNVVTAAGAGKHCFVDKPIANSVADAKAMIRACKENGVVLEIGHNTRRAGEFRKLAEIVTSGQLGTIVACEAQSSHPGGLNLTPQHWRYYRDKCPACPLMQLGVHPLDAVLSILGSVDTVSSFMRHSVMPGQNDDNTVTILQFDSGVLGYLGSQYVIPSVGYVNIYGTEGSVYVADGKVLLQRPRVADKELVEYDAVDSRIEQMSEFGDCILTGRRPETDGESALQVVAVVEAAIKSSELGRAVRVREILEDEEI